VRVELQEKLELLKDNYSDAKKEFKWDMAIFNHFIALSYANKGKRADTEKIKEIKTYIKDNTGFFSKFRGNSLSLMSLLLSFEEDYKTTFKEIEEMTIKLKENGIASYEYSPMIAYTFLKNSNKENMDKNIQRARLFYEDMKDNHVFLTSKDDYVYAALLGCTDLDVKGTCDKIEYIYYKLHSIGYSRSNGLQTVSHILSLRDDYEFRVELFNQIVIKLKQLRVKVNSYNLASIAVVALIVDDYSEICNEILEVYDDIKNAKGYKYGVQAHIKTMFSSILVTSIYTDEKNKLMDISSGLTMQLIAVAQQQAMMAAASAAAASAAASSS
jgi:Protein of unknown function (DUF4003)